MGPYTLARPKCLLPITGISLLERLVAVAHQCGVTETIVVRGKKGGAVRCPSVVYIDDPDGQNMVHSLFKAREYIRDEVIISYADILYGPAVLRRLANASADIAVVVDRNWEPYYRARAGDPLSIAESLILEGDRIIELGQPISQSTVPHGQYIGLIKLSRNGSISVCRIYDELRLKFQGKPWRNSATFEKAFMTDFIQELIDRGLGVQAIPIDGGWVEFDTAEDYESFLRWQAEGSLTRFITLDDIPCNPSVLSAGGIVVRTSPEGWSVLLVGDGKPGAWRLPKGMQEPGEAIENTAAREVEEETGIACEVVSYVGATGWSYTYDGIVWDERAHFFLMREGGGAARLTDGEHAEVAWLAADQALAELRYETERKIVRKALAHLAPADAAYRGTQ